MIFYPAIELQNGKCVGKLDQPENWHVNPVKKVVEFAATGAEWMSVIVSGMLRNLDDLSVLEYAGRLSGSITGRALFNRLIDLQEALAVAQPEPEASAEFI